MQVEIEKLEEIGIPKEQIWIKEPMKKHTSFRIGGNADIFIKAKSKEEAPKISIFR